MSYDTHFFAAQTHHSLMLLKSTAERVKDLLSTHRPVTDIEKSRYQNIKDTIEQCLREIFELQNQFPDTRSGGLGTQLKAQLELNLSSGVASRILERLNRFTNVGRT